MRKRRLSIMIVTGLLALGGLAGCSENSRSNASTETSGQTTVANGGFAAPDAGEVGKNATVAKPAAAMLTPTDVTRSVIYNGSMTVRVKDVNVAANSAAALATGSGGYLGGDDRQLNGGQSTATLTLRVPAASFNATVTALGQLGTEENRHVSAQDVTQQVVDVQSRLATQQAGVDRIRQLIAKTTSIGEIVTLENELTQRESDLESMEAQLRSLTDLTTLSTIAVVLIGPDATAAPAPAKKETGFVAGLKSGWHGFVKATSVVLTAIGTALPFAIVLGVLLAIWILIRRRRSRAATAVSAGQ